MGEFKFRAWDKKNKWPDDDFYIYSDGEVYEKSERTYNTPNIEIDQTDNLVVAQFIRRKDKAGVEIFTGDTITAVIIECGVGTSGHVVYDEELSMYANKNDAGLTPLYKLRDIEVTGSIHTQPIER